MCNVMHILDAKLKHLDEDNILGDVRKDIDQAIRGFRGNKPGNKGQGGDYQGRKNVGELRKELREREHVSYGLQN